MKPTLIIVEGQFAGESFSVAEDILSVGRDSDCDVCIHDESIDGIHCRIFRCEDAHLIKDAGSRAGTLVNQNMVDLARLNHGDVVQLGNVVIRFENQEATQLVDHTEVVFEDSEFSIEQSATLSSTGEDNSVQLTAARFQELQRDVDYFYQASRVANSKQSKSDMFRGLLALTLDWLEIGQGIVFIADDESEEVCHQVVKRSCIQSESGDARYSKRLVHRVLSEQVVIQSEFAVNPVEGDGTPKDVFAVCVPIVNNHSTLGVLYLDTYSCGNQAPVPLERIKILTTVLASTANSICLRELTHSNLIRDRFAAVGEVTSGISHRVNNILQVINGGSYLVDYGLQNDDSALVTKGWNIVKRNQSRITRLTTNLLAYSRKFEPSLTDVHLTKVIGEAFESLSETFDINRIQVKHQDSDNLSAHVDGFYTSKIIENLLSLALAASMADGKEFPVSLTTLVEPKHSVLTVSFRHLDDRFHLESIINRPANKLKAEMGMLELMVSKSHVEGQNGEFHAYTEPGNLNIIKVKLPRGVAKIDQPTLTASGVK